MMTTLRLSAALLIIMGALFFSEHGALALSSGGIGGVPAYPDQNNAATKSWFIYNLAPGESKEDGVTIINSTDESALIKVYAVDSVATADGDFSLRLEQDPRVDVGAWVEFTASSTIELAANSTKIIPFIITVPESADVGEHSGGIVIQQAKLSQAGEGARGASIQTRIGVRIYETVPGDIIRQLGLLNFSVIKDNNEDGQEVYKIDLSAQNESNVSLPANVELNITGWGMIEYFARSKAEGGFFLSDFTNFFQGQTLDKEWMILRDQKDSAHWEWPVPAFGKYDIQAVMSWDEDGETKTLSTPVHTITIIPWKIVIAVTAILALLIILILVKLFFFGKRRWRSYAVKKGDDIFSIAAIAGVGWKKIMKANKLKLPRLKPGQTILVPAKFIRSEEAVKEAPIAVKKTKKVPKKKPVARTKPVVRKKKKAVKKTQLEDTESERKSKIQWKGE